MQPAYTIGESISGLDLAQAFYREAVAPIITAAYPQLQYSAALTGTGSEILGFDDAMSRDHHWGPRAMLFMRPEDMEKHGAAVRVLLSDKLPHVFRGYPTNFSDPDPEDNGTQQLRLSDTGPVNHRVEMYTIDGFLESYIGIRSTTELKSADWLVLPQQKLRTIVEGRVFRDDLGLNVIRERLSWYPDDVWLYMLASGWRRIAQEEHLMGRAGYVGDDIGSALIASRLVRDIIRLTFLMERTYAPYPKWFGTAFAQLKAASTLTPMLTEVLRATSWEERDAALAPAYAIIARMHNALGLTEPLPTTASPFFGRPFMVIHADNFARALAAKISDPKLREIAERPFGSIDLFSDNTDLLENVAAGNTLRQLYL